MRRAALIVLVLAALLVVGLLIWLPSSVERADVAVGTVNDPLRASAGGIEQDSNSGREPRAAAPVGTAGAPPVVLAPDVRTRELFGTVRSADEGQAIRGATVQVLDTSESELSTASSDGEGRYRVAVPLEAPARVDVLVTAEGFAATRDREVPAPWTVTPRPHDVELEPACSYTGRVIASGENRPLIGAVITLRRRCGNFVTDVHEAKTDIEGSFEFRAVTDVPHRDAELFARCDGYAPALLQELHRCRADAPLETHVLELHEELRTGGRVVDAVSRVTVRDAEVRLATTREDAGAMGEWVACTTDGRFELRSREQPAELLLILARAPGYNAKALPFAHGIELELDLFPSLVVRGRVVDAETGGAVDAGSIRAWRMQSGPIAEETVRTTELAAGGSFALSVDSFPEYGWVEIEVAAPGFCAHRRRAFLTPAMKTVDFAVEPAVRLRGRVVDGGDPVEGAIVTWGEGAAREDSSTGHMVQASCTTDAQGALDLLVPRRRMEEGSLLVQSRDASNAYRLPELGLCAGGACEVTVLFSPR